MVAGRWDGRWITGASTALPHSSAWDLPRRYLWQAPRARALCLLRDSDAALADFVRDKAVALVGNAGSLLNGKLGGQIEAEDLVIRLNRGFVVDPEAQGSRTDAVSITPELSEAEIIERFSPQRLLFLTHRLRHYRIFKPENVRRTLFYKSRYWRADRRKIGRRPSSGYMMLSWLLRVGTAKSITLYGFDFGATRTYYNPSDYRTPHDFEAEREIILDWEAKNLVRIVRS